jgi:hypothetical protein
MKVLRQTSLMLLTMSALVISSGACSRNRAGRGPAPESTPTTIEVDNQAHSDVVMYVANGSTRFRLGMVPSLSSGKFALPRQLKAPNGSVQFVARPIAGRAYSLPSVLVSAGQRVLVTLLSQPALSNVAVWDQ